MKPSRLLLAVPLALAASASVMLLKAADDSLPKAQPPARYEPMALRSPFTAPTTAAPVATPPPAPPGPHWWDQMYISSLMERGGTYFATVVDKSNSKHYVLESGKADEESRLLLAQVQWSDRVDQTTVTVSKGAEIAPPLHFDPSVASSAPANPMPGNTSPGQQLYGAPGVPQRPPGISMTPPPPPPGMPSGPNVVRRNNPIGSRAPNQISPRADQPRPAGQPGALQPRRIAPDFSDQE